MEDLCDEPLELETELDMASYTTLSASMTTVDAYTTSEKLLLLAVLERAVRDLNTYVEPHTRRHAIKWFEDPNIDANAQGFTYPYCVETLELSHAQVIYLHKQVESAKAFDLRREEEAKINHEPINTYVPAHARAQSWQRKRRAYWRQSQEPRRKYGSCG